MNATVMGLALAENGKDEPVVKNKMVEMTLLVCCDYLFYFRLMIAYSDTPQEDTSQLLSTMINKS